MLFLRFCPIISIQAQDQCHSCRYAMQKPAWMHPHFPKCHTPKFVLKIFIFSRQAEINPDTHINCRCHGKDQKNNPEDFLFLLSPVNLPRYIFRLVIFWMIPFFHFYLSVLCVTLVRCSYMSRTYLHPAHCGRFNVSPSLCPVGVAAHPPSAVSRSSIGRLLPT